MCLHTRQHNRARVCACGPQRRRARGGRGEGRGRGTGAAARALRLCRGSARGALTAHCSPEDRSVSFMTSAQAASFSSWSRYSMAVVFHRQGYLRTVSMKWSMARAGSARAVRQRRRARAAHWAARPPRRAGRRRSAPRAAHRAEPARGARRAPRVTRARSPYLHKQRATVFIWQH